MSRLLACMANDAQRLRCVLHPIRAALAREAEGIDAVGIGFHQGGEMLLQRRPRSIGSSPGRTSQPAERIDFFELAGELRTDALIGHMRRGTIGSTKKNENTPPFRFRSWLFAHHGTVADFASAQPVLLDAIPDFLRRNLRGETDSELLFHHFLAELQRAQKLDDPLLSPSLGARALDYTIAACDRAVGHGDSTLDLAATNGRILLFARRGAPARYFVVDGIRDCAVCGRAPGGPGRELPPVHHDDLKAVVFLADDDLPELPAPWRELPSGSIATVSHSLELHIAPISG